jgi:hypothetical protein
MPGKNSVGDIDVSLQTNARVGGPLES